MPGRRAPKPSPIPILDLPAGTAEERVPSVAVSCSPLTPAQRSLRARVAAFALHSRGGTSTAAASRAFLARFEAAVDPDGKLTPEERARRARLALKAHMLTLSLKASRVRYRRAKSTARAGGAVCGSNPDDSTRPAGASGSGHS